MWLGGARSHQHAGPGYVGPGHRRSRAANGAANRYACAYRCSARNASAGTGAHGYAGSSAHGRAGTHARSRADGDA